jgi:hypothetical protein
MLQYLGNLPVHFWPSKQVLELGAGTGLLGIYVATQGASVTITDRPEVVPLLQKNIDLTAAKSCVAEALAWENACSSVSELDVLLVCECLYSDLYYEALAHTIKSYTASRTVVVFGYKRRDEDRERKFFALLEPSMHIHQVFDEPSTRCVLLLLVLKPQAATQSEASQSPKGTACGPLLEPWFGPFCRVSPEDVQSQETAARDNCSICKEAHLARQQFHVTQQQTVAVLVAVALCIAAAKATHQTPVRPAAPAFLNGVSKSERKRRVQNRLTQQMNERVAAGEASYNDFTYGLCPKAVS